MPTAAFVSGEKASAANEVCNCVSCARIKSFPVFPHLQQYLCKHLKMCGLTSTLDVNIRRRVHGGGSRQLSTSTKPILELVFTSSDGCGPRLLTTLNSPSQWLHAKCTRPTCLAKATYAGAPSVTGLTFGLGINVPHGLATQSAFFGFRRWFTSCFCRNHTQRA